MFKAPFTKCWCVGSTITTLTSYKQPQQQNRSRNNNIWSEQHDLVIFQPRVFVHSWKCIGFQPVTFGARATLHLIELNHFGWSSSLQRHNAASFLPLATTADESIWCRGWCVDLSFLGIVRGVAHELQYHLQQRTQVLLGPVVSHWW